MFRSRLIQELLCPQYSASLNAPSSEVMSMTLTMTLMDSGLFSKPVPWFYLLCISAGYHCLSSKPSFFALLCAPGDGPWNTSPLSAGATLVLDFRERGRDIGRGRGFSFSFWACIFLALMAWQVAFLQGGMGEPEVHSLQ